ncbi:hypothetical protein ILUMI_00022 [Ignelater luminosus]|uniref:Major facilitator superfamily domain-containing protein 12-like n=1 Tax=Ignelater luminosus TaxID=2038154 RepID=A0A8K0DLB4_IGNLU|nr:hypothetical protein ILUMI_00022 [Ignelater luminosus]
MDSVSITLINNNNDEKVYHPELSSTLQFGFGVGHVLNDIYTALWLSYFIVYLTKVRKFVNSEAGFLMLLGQVADAVANVIIGKLSDKNINNIFFKKVGRRKAWHLIGVFVDIISITAIFLPCPFESHTLKLIYMSFWVAMFQFGWAAVQITHLALIPEITSDENDRTKLSATRQFFTVLSSVLVYAISWAAFGAKAENAEFSPEYAPTFGYIVFFGTIVGFACSMVFQFTIKESPYIEEKREKKAIPFREMVGKLKYWQAVGIYMFTMLFVNSCQVLIPPYLSDTLGMDATSLAVIPLIMFSASGVTSFCLAVMKRKCERKRTYAIGTVCGLGAILWIGIRSYSPGFASNEIYCIVVFIGIATATTTVTILGLTADLIGDHTDSGALVYSIMTVADKLINGVAVYTIQHLREDSDDSSYYKHTIEIVCGSALILASIIILTYNEKTARREGYIPLE